MKGYKRPILYAFLFACLSFLVAIAFFDLFLRYYNFEKKIKEFPLNISKTEYPVFKTPIAPNITAKAVVIMDDESKTILFSKNPNLLFSMASTTKIMTALVALDYYKLNDILTVKSEKVEGVNVGFKIGEKLKFEDILYAMLLPSGNDAALALAQNYLPARSAESRRAGKAGPGGEKEFVKKMNEKARSLNLINTNFADPIGLEDSQDYTTPLDLIRLTSAALENKIFADVVKTKTLQISDVTGENEYLLKNLNKLLGVSGVNGVKTGTTTEAGQVLVTSKQDLDSSNNKHTFIIVVMNSEDRFSDTRQLLDLISGNINYLSIHP